VGGEVGQFADDGEERSEEQSALLDDPTEQHSQIFISNEAKSFFESLSGKWKNCILILFTDLCT
jgi:hypothetical protein